MEKMKVLVGAPVRNRAWILQRHIDAIKAQDIPFETCYVVNDCTDETESILRRNGFRCVRYDLGDVATADPTRNGYSYANLAELRNRLLDEFLASDCEYLFSVDTDIIIPPGTISRLMQHGVDIVSALIPNSPSMDAYNIMRHIGGGVYQHILDWTDGLMEVDATGAVYLIRRDVIEAGVRYGWHPQGEDLYFCREARRRGFRLWCDTSIRPVHVYGPGIELCVR
jgi:glycosyltransferase involved in cell wall biosynthesis